MRASMFAHVKVKENATHFCVNAHVVHTHARTHTHTHTYTHTHIVMDKPYKQTAIGRHNHGPP